MTFKLVGQFPEGIEELQTDYDFSISDDCDVVVICEQSDQNQVKVSFDHNEGHITYKRPNHFFRAFGLFVQHVQAGETKFTIEETPQFDTVGPMFDLSRNAVMKVDRFKEMIRMLAVMGFDSAMLYMEDTYEVKQEPYFGYMRGRYSYDELKELDDYAHRFGIE